MSVRFYLGENVHPSFLPENQFRTTLYQGFHSSMMPEVSPLLGKGTPVDPPVGFERAWRIFLGTMINGQLHYVCHITQDFKTARAYNCVDSTTPTYPALLWGEPFHIKKEMMDQIRAQFPAHHAGNVPFQAALAITPSSAASDPEQDLTNLFSGHIDTLETPNYRLSLLAPTGTQSLSFREDGFPIQFWTHASRHQVIETAYNNACACPDSDPAIVALYGQAYKLEDEHEQAMQNLKTLEKELEKKENALTKEETSLLKLAGNARVPERVKDQKKQRIAQLERDIQTLKAQIAAAKQTVAQARADIDHFKASHFDKLPHSYREATFQLAFDTELPDDSVVYKQYNSETGAFELSTDADRAVRYGNDVHIPYLDL